MSSACEAVLRTGTQPLAPEVLVMNLAVSSDNVVIYTTVLSQRAWPQCF